MIKRNLSSYDFPGDLKKMDMKELKLLSYQIREFLIDTLSDTGGHLASNLGVVELTLALHYVFESPHDKIVWDVGHQTYVHKILTGRASRFNTLRKYGGLSGFPKNKESEHDIFDTGRGFGGRVASRRPLPSESFQALKDHLLPRARIRT